MSPTGEKPMMEESLPTTDEDEKQAFAKAKADRNMVRRSFGSHIGQTPGKKHGYDQGAKKNTEQTRNQRFSYSRAMEEDELF